MTDYVSRFDPEMKDVLNYLKNRPEICDIYVQEILPAVPAAINEWEMKHLCTIPADLKAFYLIRNGIHIEWKIKLDNEVTLPLGKILINNINDLTKVGTALQKDYKDPSLFDLEDVQNHNNCRHFITFKQTFIWFALAPHFDEKSRNFELDNCNGFGKVCLVYSSRPGVIAENAEIWFLDRSLQWHFLANSFTNYYRLIISHLGLPQWQMLFTDDGLPPMLYQWFYLLAPGRILIHEESWKNLIDSKKIKQNFDPNKVFKEKDAQKKPNQSQTAKIASSSSSNLNSNNMSSVNSSTSGSIKRRSFNRN